MTPYSNKTDDIPRYQLWLLLTVHGLAFLSHLPRVPITLSLAYIIIVIWRVKITQGQWNYPNRWVKALLVVVAVGAVVSHYDQWFALESLVGLLVTAFVLKLIEVKGYRDAIGLVYIAYLIIACHFLFNQTLLMTLYAVVTLWVITAVLLALHENQPGKPSRRTLRLTSALLLQSVPLMLVMFFILPRFGALWSVPIQSDSSYTGVSDSMSPGDFSNLTRNGELAFRASFDGPIPVVSDRYWRGLVLTDFDGRRWQRSALSIVLSGDSFMDRAYATPVINTEREANSYQIVLEATGQDWLYTLPYGQVQNRAVARSVQQELVGKLIDQRIQYRVNSSAISAWSKPTLAPQIRRESLFLPEGFNEKTNAMAKQWRSEVDSDQAYIRRVLDFYNARFSYTLSPPLLGRDSVDEFLFSSLAGFCEHFSSSFVVLMRSAGIPARVVVGYQGGEINDIDQYVMVYQYDAHAWAEVWLAGKGWVRVDPTAAVAPNRVEQGLREALTDTDREQVSDAYSLSRYRSVAWLNRLRLEWDRLNFRWQRWVLSYDKQTQKNWLRELLGDITPLRIALVLLIPGGVLLAIVAWGLLRNRRVYNTPEAAVFHEFTRLLARRGLPLESGETPAHYCERVSVHFPFLKQRFDEISLLLNAGLYQDGNQGDNLDALKRHLRALKKIKFSYVQHSSESS